MARWLSSLHTCPKLWHIVKNFGLTQHSAGVSREQGEKSAHLKHHRGYIDSQKGEVQRAQQEDAETPQTLATPTTPRLPRADLLLCGCSAEWQSQALPLLCPVIGSPCSHGAALPPLLPSRKMTLLVGLALSLQEIRDVGTSDWSSRNTCFSWRNKI